MSQLTPGHDGDDDHRRDDNPSDMIKRLRLYQLLMLARQASRTANKLADVLPLLRHNRQIDNSTISSDRCHVYKTALASVVALALDPVCDIVGVDLVASSSSRHPNNSVVLYLIHRLSPLTTCSSSTTSTVSNDTNAQLIAQLMENHLLRVLIDFLQHYKHQQGRYPLSPAECVCVPYRFVIRTHLSLSLSSLRRSRVVYHMGDIQCVPRDAQLFGSRDRARCGRPGSPCPVGWGLPAGWCRVAIAVAKPVRPTATRPIVLSRRRSMVFPHRAIAFALCHAHERFVVVVCPFFFLWQEGGSVAIPTAAAAAADTFVAFIV